MYEVEIKVEINNKQRQELIESLKSIGFVSKGVTPQNDFYIEAKESPYGGFDLKRYRNEGDKFIYTEKTWETIEGQPIRREIQHNVSKEEFDSKISEFKDAVKIIKDREWFIGDYQGTEISFTIDSVKFDHSPGMRYFIEAEIGVADKNDVLKTKEFVRDFLKEILDMQKIIESPGMFTMAFKKI